MEKLEAALAKARAMRNSVADAPEIAPRRAVTRRLPMVGWTSTLPEIAPKPGLMQRNRISSFLGGRDAVPYDMLRSRTIRILKEKGWSRLAITSPGAACGKTTVALNLAISLARQKDLNVMLIDLDLRRPALHKVLG
ncbi:MAG: chromosome partitioning ATPase-like protein, partial [Albidovulum sp.]|uniref:tyrosine-protein kinase family protein n=1 Tax=Albidovulum sp. TaxID=1872424 RepID=UPI003C8C827C